MLWGLHSKALVMNKMLPIGLFLDIELVEYVRYSIIWQYVIIIRYKHNERGS